ncbi:class I adenylate-forming enzyme family protein [Caenimonas koreensis]|uniref:class I adenylate-forming enzyme family protein n=1 Tax=Caenimonas koreensis TaxID=367474 RepID=UPI003784637D
MPQLPVPSVFAAIQLHARMSPHEPAVVTNTEILTYRRFCKAIDRVSRLLQEQNLPADSRVAVVVGTPYAAWLVNIALSRLALLACECTASGLKVLKPTVVVTDAPLAHAGARVITMTKEWLDPEAAPIAPAQEALLDPSKPARIVMSSGTTGLPKLAMFTAGEFDERLRTMALAYGLTTTSRTLCLMGMPSIGGIVWPLATWMAGGVVLLTTVGPNKPLIKLLRDKPTHLFVSTAQLEQLVQSLPADFTPQRDLVTYVAGSVLPRALNQAARARLGQSLMMVYGSTEVGTATLAPAAHVDFRPGLTGYVCPPAEIEIVDEAGRTLPLGETGIVRTRNVGQVHRYLDDDKTTAETFRDTWFYPGDLGAMGPDGELFVKGRALEVMNFGGVKVTPNAIDEVAAKVPGVVEAAAFVVADKAAKQWPHIAVVAGADFDEARLIKRIGASFPSVPPLKVVRVDKLPRNDMGKILRLELADKHKAA